MPRPSQRGARPWRVTLGYYALAADIAAIQLLLATGAVFHVYALMAAGLVAHGALYPATRWLLHGRVTVRSTVPMVAFVAAVYVALWTF